MSLHSTFHAVVVTAPNEHTPFYHRTLFHLLSDNRLVCVEQLHREVGEGKWCWFIKGTPIWREATQEQETMLRRSVLDGETIYFYRQGKGEPCLGTLDGYRPVTRFSVGEVAEKVAGDTVKQPVHEWLADHLHRCGGFELSSCALRSS